MPRVFDLSADFKLNVFDELSSTALSIGEYFPEKDDFLVLWVSKGGINTNSFTVLSDKSCGKMGCSQRTRDGKVHYC